MLRRYEKILKRNIRRTKAFRKGNKIKIISISSNTLNFCMGIIDKLNKKYDLQLHLEITKYDKLEDIKFEPSIMIIPIEAIILSYLIYTYTKDVKYLNLFKYQENNLVYNLSEFYISKYMKSRPVFFTSSYRKLLDFIYDIIGKKEKYANSLSNFFSYLKKFY